MSNKNFERDQERQDEMSSGLFNTWKQFMKDKEDWLITKDELALIITQIKLSETYTKQILAGVHIGQLIEKRKALDIAMKRIERN